MGLWVSAGARARSRSSLCRFSCVSLVDLVLVERCMVLLKIFVNISLTNLLYLGLLLVVLRTMYIGWARVRSSVLQGSNARKGQLRTRITVTLSIFNFSA